MSTGATPALDGELAMLRIYKADAIQVKNASDSVIATLNARVAKLEHALRKTRLVIGGVYFEIFDDLYPDLAANIVGTTPETKVQP